MNLESKHSRSKIEYYFKKMHGNLNPYMSWQLPGMFGLRLEWRGLGDNKVSSVTSSRFRFDIRYMYGCVLKGLETISFKNLGNLMAKVSIGCGIDFPI